MKERVSIVIPVYNTDESQLKDCIYSILEQSYDNYEVIIVDDGSNKETKETLKNIAEQNKQVTVITTSNNGASVARNIGIENSTGDYITFVDADDWIETTYIELMLKEFDQDIDIVICSRYLEYRNRTIENHFYSANRVFTNLEVSDLIVDAIETGIGGTWCKVYKRSFLEKERLRYDGNLRRTQDIIFNLAAFRTAKIVKYLDKCLYHYRMQGKSITKAFNPNIDIYLNRVVKEFELIYESEYFGVESIRRAIYHKEFMILNEIMILKIFNRSYENNTRTKQREAYELIHTEPYSVAINNLNFGDMNSTVSKLKLMLFKKSMVISLNALYGIQCIVQEMQYF